MNLANNKEKCPKCKAENDTVGISTVGDKGESESSTRLVYNKDKKRFVIVKDELPKQSELPVNNKTFWVEPIFEHKEWNVTPIIPNK